MNVALELNCRDPIVARDGRPFGPNAGNRMRSTGWPLPSVVAGSFRTALGKKAGREFTPDVVAALLQTAVAGVLPCCEGELYLPAPQDCVLGPDRRALRAAPWENAPGGANWPAEGLKPVTLTPEQAGQGFKPIAGPAWWPGHAYAQWLLGKPVKFDGRFLRQPESDERTHVQIVESTGAAEEGRIFTSSALALTHLPRWNPEEATTDETSAAIKLAARITATDWAAQTSASMDDLHPLGGERRLVHWKATASDTIWQCPDSVRHSLREARRVRLALATPAVFSEGWRPGWLDAQLCGRPPGYSVQLRLVGVCTQRWQAVSGWSLERHGPKPVKRLVPAGGVYFFDVTAGDPAELATAWLQSVSDDEQDQRDGFGLGVWGVW